MKIHIIMEIDYFCFNSFSFVKVMIPDTDHTHRSQDEHSGYVQHMFEVPHILDAWMMYTPNVNTLGSQTDKPVLAFAVYQRFLQNAAKNAQLNTSAVPIDDHSFLRAAFTGSSLTYRR